MERIKPKYQYKKGGNQRSDNIAYYFFDDKEQKIRVCKTFFHATLSITDMTTRTALRKMDTWKNLRRSKGKTWTPI